MAEEYPLFVLSPLRRLGGASASTALPGSCAWELQPYRLRRGEATARFQATNSFAKVAERGRERALKGKAAGGAQRLQQVQVTSLEAADSLSGGDDCKQSRPGRALAQRAQRRATYSVEPIRAFAEQCLVL